MWMTMSTACQARSHAQSASGRMKSRDLVLGEIAPALIVAQPVHHHDSWPRPLRAATRFEPMKPAPPVTTYIGLA